MTNCVINFIAENKIITKLIKTPQKKKMNKYFFHLFSIKKILLQNIRIVDSNEVYDTICLSEFFLNDVDQLMAVFDQISDENAFQSQCNATWDSNSKELNWSSPLWFNSNSF